MNWMLCAVLVTLMCTVCAAQPAEVPVANPGFEDGLKGWALVKAEHASVDHAVRHSGEASLKLSAADQFHPYVAQGVKPLQGGAKYALRAWAKGAAGGATTATLKIEYYNDAGQNTHGFYSGNVKLNSDEWKQLEIEAVADPDTTRASILLRLMSPGEVWFDDVTFTMTGAPAAVTLNPVRSAVESGQGAEVAFDVRLREPWNNQPPKVTLSNAAGQSVGGATAQVEAKEGGLLAVKAKLPALPPGDYVLSLDFAGETGTTKVFAYDLRKPKNLTDTGTLLVGGKPFFPIGIYHAGVSQYQLLADNGFNAVQGANPPALEDFQKVLDEGQRTGIMIDVPFYAGGKVKANLPDTLAKVAAFRDHPAVLNWKIIDEPDLRPDVIDEVAEAYREIRKADDAHPVLLTIASPPSFPYWVHFCDMLQVDPYPIPRNPLTQVSDTVKAAKAVLRPWQHLTAVLQSGWIMDGDKPANQPTYEQALAMVYLSLINGAKGIFWYSMHDPGWDLTKTPLWARMKELNEETARMGRLVTEGEPAGAVEVESKNVQAAAWRLEGQRQVLVTNPTPEPQTAVLKLAGAVTVCERHGDGEAAVEGGGIKVSLPGYGSATLAVR